MSVKLLTERHLEFLSLKRGYIGSSESNLSKCHIVGNHMLRLISFAFTEVYFFKHVVGLFLKVLVKYIWISTGKST